MLRLILVCLLFLHTFEASPLNSPQSEDESDEADLSVQILEAIAGAGQVDNPDQLNSEQLGTFSKLCKCWNKRQPSDEKIKEIVDSLPPCRPLAPLTPEGKFPDGFDSFTVDGGCNPNGNIIEKGCVFHPGAKACYRSEPLNGHDQQCCYSNDGKLLVGPPGGGTLDMSTGFMHVFDDVLPYLVCCRFSKQCDLYYQKRPSDDGSRWHPTQ